MTFDEQLEIDRSNWVDVSKRVTSGELDDLSMTLTRRITKRLPPQGSLAESLRIGLRGYSHIPVCREALDYVNRP